MNLSHFDNSLSRNACMVFPGAFEINSGFDEEISMKMYWENVRLNGTLAKKNAEKRMRPIDKKNLIVYIV